MKQKKHIKSWRILAIGLTLLFVAVSGAFADDGEISLPRADQLIREKRYDAAIRVLTEYGTRHPEEFDKVQTRLREIVRARDEYNVLTERLIDVLRNDPENYELILSITNRIENIEPEPNEVVGEFVRRTRQLALFTLNRNRLDQILQEGRNFIDRMEYSAALSVYSSGTDLYREEFYAAQYGDLVYSEIENDMRLIRESIAEFNRIQERIVSVLAEFEHVISQDSVLGELEAVSRVFNEVETSLGSLMTVRNTLANAGYSIQSQSALLRQIDDSQGDASHLPFLLRLIEGRPTETVQEGMLGAMDSLWLRVRDSVLLSLIMLSNNNYQRAVDLGRQSLFVRSEQQFTGVMTLNDMIEKTILWENQKEGLSVPVFIVVDGAMVTQKHLPEYFQFYAMSRSVSHIIAAQDANMTLRTLQAPGFNSVWQWRDGIIAAAEAISREERIFVQFDNFAGEIRAGLSALEETGSALYAVRIETGAAFDYNIYLNEARSYYNTLLASAFDQQTASVQRRYTIANGELDKRRAARQAEFDEANVLIAGISTGEGDDAQLLRYPTEANTLLTELLEIISEDIQSGNDLIGQYSGERPEMKNAAEIAALQTDAGNIVLRLESLRDLAGRTSLQAEALIGEANSLKLDGDRLVEEALAAMNQNNFTAARDQLRRASNQYDESLRIQESEQLRRLRDNQLISYYDEINRRENAIILVQVRRLIDQAKSDFNLQNFERADDALSQAKDLYLRTNSETSEEILYWQGIVRNALSLRSGTTIPSTAPLYSEMSQLLRDAYLAYESGSALFNQNRRSEGTARLNDARQKLQEVRLVFPLNEEAGILSLRIDQLIDPGFEEKFRSQVDAAFQLVMQESSVEAYATLKNLSVIHPDYPGMNNLLYRAGVHFGEIIPPPSAAEIARANQLNDSARRIIDNNIQAQFSTALEMLNESIRLNPGNNTTAQLIDRVNTLMGGSSTIMVSADKQKYNTAVREFQLGNRLIAQRLVDELWANPRNRNSSELIQLKERIEAFL